MTAEEFMIAPHEVRWNGKRMSDIHLYIKRYLYKNVKYRTCISCGYWLTFENATIEHIKRLADGGDYSPSNIHIACNKCNSGRGIRSINEYRNWLIKKKRIRKEKVIPYPIINLE